MRQNDSLSSSFLTSLDPSLLDEIRRRAIVHHHRSGDLIVSEADDRWTEIMLSGMARVFVTTQAGRQVTLWLAQRGEAIGIGPLLSEGTVSAQAVTDCAVLQLDTLQVVRLARVDPALAVAIATEVSQTLFETYREIVLREHGSIRQRLARHLLHLGGVLDPATSRGPYEPRGSR